MNRLLHLHADRRRNRRTAGRDIKGGTILAEMSRRLRRFYARRFRSTTRSPPPKKWVDERIITQYTPTSSNSIQLPSSSRHVRQHSKELLSIVSLDDMRAELDVVSTTLLHDQVTLNLSHTDCYDESSLISSQLSSFTAGLISNGENTPPRRIRLMSPPRVNRMKWSLTSYTTSSLEYSSSLDYSDDDSIVEKMSSLQT